MPEQDLMSILPSNLKNDKRAFSCHGIRSWDSEVCFWLLSQGYESKCFHSINADSSEPLVRGVKIRKFGSSEWVLYTYM